MVTFWASRGALRGSGCISAAHSPRPRRRTLPAPTRSSSRESRRRSRARHDAGTRSCSSGCLRPSPPATHCCSPAGSPRARTRRVRSTPGPSRRWPARDSCSRTSRAAPRVPQALAGGRAHAAHRALRRRLAGTHRVIANAATERWLGGDPAAGLEPPVQPLLAPGARYTPAGLQLRMARAQTRQPPADAARPN